MAYLGEAEDVSWWLNMVYSSVVVSIQIGLSPIVSDPCAYHNVGAYLHSISELGARLHGKTAGPGEASCDTK